MVPNYTYHRFKTLLVFAVCLAGFGILVGRLGYLMLFQSAHYTALAEELHERERSIKAARGRIYDANGNLKEQIADRALLPEEYGEALAALSDCTLYSIERRKGRYEISIDGEDHTFLLAVSGNGDVQEWERFLSLDGEF